MAMTFRRIAAFRLQAASAWANSSISPHTGMPLRLRRGVMAASSRSGARPGLTATKSTPSTSAA
jgi:hypothetical protein